MIGLLTEAASAKIATPITLDSSDLKGHSRGLPRYERRVNFPNPWPGGTWRLRDIVDYELIAAEALVKLASDQRGEYVRTFVQLGRKEIELGKAQAPYAWEIPYAQRDPSAVSRLVEVLRVGGVEVQLVETVHLRHVRESDAAFRGEVAADRPGRVALDDVHGIAGHVNGDVTHPLRWLLGPRHDVHREVTNARQQMLVEGPGQANENEQSERRSREAEESLIAFPPFRGGRKPPGQDGQAEDGEASASDPVEDRDQHMRPPPPDAEVRA
jgi:hypothetical protein